MPEMAFAVPVNVIFPAEAAKVPAVEISPKMMNVLVVVTEPVIERLLNEIDEPLIVLPEPLKVSVPLEWENVPAPVVARLPEIPIVEELATIFDAVIVKL